MTRYGTQSPRAVALVEVLAATTTILLSISVALPVMVKAREPARRAMCVDNLHRRMEGMLAYAGDHQGKGPMRGWFNYTIAETGHEAGWGVPGSSKVLVNLGMLHTRWNGGKHDMLYCPSTLSTFRDNPIYGWHTTFDPAVTFTVGSYNYGIVLARRALASPDLVGANPFPSGLWDYRFIDWIEDEWQPRHPGETFQIPDSPALVTDMWIGGLKPVHGPGVNVLYTDGHVRYHDISGISVTSGSLDQYETWYKLSLRQ